MRTVVLFLFAAAALSMASCAAKGNVEVSDERGDEVAVTGRFIVAATGQPYWVDSSNPAPDPRNWPIHANALLESGDVRSLRVEYLGLEGRFRARGIPASVQRLEFHSNQTLKTFVPFDAANASVGGEANLGDVKLDYGLAIHVKVVGPNGEEVKRAQLRLTTRGDDPTDRSDTTDERGEYTFRGFRAGPAEMTAYADRDRGNEWVNNRNFSADGKQDVVTIDVIIQDSPVTEILIRFPRRSQ